jgi:transcription elongation factor Elf1
MAGARREVKLPYTEKHMRCPHCDAGIVVGTVMGKIQMARRTCPVCKKEFLIENDKPKKLDVGRKKPSESAKPIRAVRSAQSAKRR